MKFRIALLAQGILLAATTLLPAQQTSGTLEKRGVPPGIEGERDLARQKALLEVYALSPDGKTAYTASRSGEVAAWEVESGRKIKTLLRDAKAHTALAVRPDGERLYCAFGDGVVSVVDIGTAQVMHQLKAGPGHVTCISFSGDGKWVITGSWGGKAVEDAPGARTPDNDVRVWSTLDGTLRQRIKGHSATINAVCLNRDGSVAISTGMDRSVRVDDVATGTNRYRLDGPDLYGTGLELLDDDRRAVLSTGNGSVYLLDITTGECLRRYVGHNSQATILTVSRDEKLLAVTGRLRGIPVTLWDVDNSSPRLSLQQNGKAIGLAISPDNRTLVAGVMYKYLSVVPIPPPPQERETSETLCLEPWRKAWNMEQVLTMRSVQGDTAALSFADAETYLFAVNRLPEGGRFCAFDLTSERARGVLDLQTTHVLGVAFSSEATRFAWSSSGEDKLKTFAIKNRYATRQDSSVPTPAFDMLAFTPDATRILGVDTSGTLELVESPSGKAVSHLSPAAGQESFTRVAILPDGGRALALRGRHRATAMMLTLPSLEADKGFKPLDLGTDVEDLDISPDGAMVAVATTAGAITLHSLAEQKLVRSMAAGGATKVRFARKGAWLVGAMMDQTVHVWETATGRELASANIWPELGQGAGARLQAQSMAVSADGMSILCGDRGGLIRHFRVSPQVLPKP